MLAILYGLALAGPVAAQSNRLFNPEFDSDTVGWDLRTAPDFSGWDPEDRDGCDGSGSVLISGQELGILTAFVAQCIPVFGGETLHFKLETHLLFAWSPVHGAISMLYTIGGCSIAGFDDDFSPWELLPLSEWSRLDGTFVVPAGAVSAWVAFHLVSDASFGAQLDGAWGAESTARIFDGDFEYGSTCRW